MKTWESIRSISPTDDYTDGRYSGEIKTKNVSETYAMRIEHNGYVGYAKTVVIDGVPQNTTLEWDIHQ